MDSCTHWVPIFLLLPLCVGMSCFYSRSFFFATVKCYSTFKCTIALNNLSYPWASTYRQIVSFSRARYNKTIPSMTDHIPKIVRMEFLWRPQERKCIPFGDPNSLFIFFNRNFPVFHIELCPDWKLKCTGISLCAVVRFAAGEGMDKTRQKNFHPAANKENAFWPLLECCPHFHDVFGKAY